MKLGILIINLVCIVVDSKYSECGPGRSCRCNHTGVMDCSDNKQLQLKRVCDFINNTQSVPVTDLYVKKNGYNHVGKEDLKGCNSLKKLFLGNNEIVSIEEFSFTTFDQLETLDLSFNQLTVSDGIGKQIFARPLKKLMLNGNLLDNGATYPDLSNMTYLEELTLDGMKDKVFAMSYKDMRTLKTVSLSGLNGNCSIPHVTNFTFQNLHHIRALNLSFCGTQNIDAGAFQSLARLEVLDLSHNLNLGLRVLRNVSYSLQFTNIKSLNFSKVYTTFGMGTFFKVQDICYLWNTSLTELVLINNRIELIETNAQILVPESLKILRVEENKFTFGLYLLQLGCFTNLEEFYGNYQNYPHDPRSYLEEPRENVNDNINFTCPFARSLLNISKSKGNCHYFDSDTHVHTTFPDPTLPKNLTRLEFSSCNMQFKLPYVSFYTSPFNLEYLDLSNNILDTWFGSFFNFSSIKYLNLSRNYCSHIGLEFFDAFPSVENLQIQENFLGLVLSNKEYGPNVFNKLANLKVLNLSSNIISELSRDVFSNMQLLKTLDLSVNNIESFMVDVSNLNSLLHLILKFNFIRTLPTSLLEKLESNEERLKENFTIDLSNNILTINCKEKYFLKWIVKHRKKMLNFDNYVFQNENNQPISVEHFVKSVNSLEIDCIAYIPIIATCSIGISVFLSVIIGGVVYKNRWKLRYLMRINKMKHFGYSRLHEIPNEEETFIYDAFISYANEDLRFIISSMIPKLEENGIRVCLHDRDFLPGNDIADNILQAIRSSRKTVVVLSKEFLKRKWCLYEFNMARMESIYARGGNSCMIVVMFEDIPTRNMSNEMLDWMSSNTYIEYTTEPDEQILFWDNFLHVLNE